MDGVVTRLALTGTGIFTPAQSIANDELVASFNEYVRRYNALHATAISAAKVEPLQRLVAEAIGKVLP